MSALTERGRKMLDAIVIMQEIGIEIMLIGTMEVLEDNDTKQMIWQDGDTMYYPKGVTDPDYCVLHFTANTGRYYANFHSDSIEIL